MDVEGGMAPYMWYLVERAGGAFNFFLHTNQVIDVTRLSWLVLAQ